MAFLQAAWCLLSKLNGEVFLIFRDTNIFEGRPLKRYSKILMFVISMGILLSSNVAIAGSVPVIGLTSWSYVSPDTMVFYKSGYPVALVRVFGLVSPASQIVFVDDFLMAGMRILIDGRVCHIMKVERLN